MAFEDALAVYGEECKDRWEKIAAIVPGKDAAEIKLHYELLVEDIECIEAGRISLPFYVSSGEGSADQAVEIHVTKNRSHSANFHSGDVNPTEKGGSKAVQERRKGIAWTEEEHRLFLLGLDKYGKSDWRSISRNCVISRTPMQVASHAQKYFIRMNSANKDRRRSSIHDITSVNNGDTSIPQGSITGHGNGSTGAV
jgi:SHAQKYF class myb-like DNA-binding protein